MRAAVTVRRLAIVPVPAARVWQRTLVLAPAPRDASGYIASPQFVGRRAFFWGSGNKNDGDGGDQPPSSDGGGSSSSAITGDKASSSPAPAPAPAPAASPAQSPAPAPAQPEASSSKDMVPVASRSDGLSQDMEAPIEPDLMAFPLRERPLLPGHRQIVFITNPKVIEEFQKIADKSGTRNCAVFLQKLDPPLQIDGPQGIPGAAEDLGDRDALEALHVVGTRAHIHSFVPFRIEDEESVKEGVQAVLQGKELIRLDKVLQQGPPLRVQASLLSLREPKPRPDSEDLLKVWAQEMMQTIRELTRLSPQFRDHANLINHSISATYLNRQNRQGVHQLAHFAVSFSGNATGAEQQEVIAEEDPVQKLTKAVSLLKKELHLAKLQQKIAGQLEEKMSKQQREFYLREQLKAIKKELGEDKSDGSDKLLEKFKKRLEDKTIPKDAKEAIDAELEKFANLAKESQEFQITRNYLDWLTVLPWSIHSKDTLSLQKAREVLDRDHYGLDDVKQRILELIAVGSLRGGVQGKIVCLVGPPGVGKTSIGKSIAQALNREFYRFSVGGLYDVAEIKGHRRTYVGAMPGKVIQCLKKVQTANPLVLIDEVDKIGRGHQGDPASALLELLDPSQNENFLDHYLDVPFDCSKVLFVCTANVTDTIPGPLLDRMEVIRLSGYDMREKLRIAEDYLVPTAMREVGLWPQPQKESSAEEPAEAAGPTAPSTEKADQATPSAVEENAQQQPLKTDAGESSSQQTAKVDAKEPAEPAGASGESSQASKVEAEPEPEPSSSILSSSEVAPATTPAAPTEVTVPTPPPVKATISSSAIEMLIRWYCREAGVRNLQKHIERICRKLSVKVVEQRENSESTNKENEEQNWDFLHVVDDKLSDYVGKQVFLSDRLYEDGLPPGTVTGLAWTSMGGSVLYVEAVGLPRLSEAKAAPSISITGQLGSVMKESSQIALLVARQTLGKEKAKFFEEHEVHVHCPEGATPKDGPSAGVTMVTSLVSLASATPIRQDLAMTGEVSLNGKVLPVGGIKEKTIAARRAGCNALVFPEANRRDFDELPEYLREGLEVHYATHIAQVLKVALPEVTL